MSEEDRHHWDDRYLALGMAPSTDHGPPPAFVSGAHLFPTTGLALELACGRGRAAVWLARRGLTVTAVDVSPVAIDLAERLAAAEGVADRCRFGVFDLDRGLPEGSPVDLVMCHLFRDPRLDRGVIDRLRPGGILAIACLSEVGVGPGPFRVRAGELLEAFSDLETLGHGEGDGLAWLVARHPASDRSGAGALDGRSTTSSPRSADDHRRLRAFWARDGWWSGTGSILRPPIFHNRGLGTLAWAFGAGNPRRSLERFDDALCDPDASLCAFDRSGGRRRWDAVRFVFRSGLHWKQSLEVLGKLDAIFPGAT